MDAVDRFLAVVRKELKADDARLELGGRPPATPAVFAELEDGWRVVAVFDGAVDDAEEKAEHLRALIASFDATLAGRREAAPVPPVARAATVQTELQLTLQVLCDRAKAVGAVVVDEQSPAVWGTSDGASWLDDAARAQELGALLNGAADSGFDTIAWLGEAADVTPALPKDLRDALVRRRPALRLLIAQTTAPAARLAVLRAVALAREGVDTLTHAPAFGAITRRFGGIYRLALAFDATYSELHAEATVARALPVIERLVHDLPPIEPTPKGARVLKFDR